MDIWLILAIGCCICEIANTLLIFYQVGIFQYLNEIKKLSHKLSHKQIFEMGDIINKLFKQNKVLSKISFIISIIIAIINIAFIIIRYDKLLMIRTVCLAIWISSVISLINTTSRTNKIFRKNGGNLFWHLMTLVFRIAL